LCWGLNQSGQVGVASTALRVLQPASVAGGLTLNQIGAGGAFNCGLAADSTAVCWGWNAYGQLGDSSRTDRSAPIPVVGGLRFTALTAGTWHTCGIVDDSSAYCWGRNANGQLGDGTTADTAGPVAVQGGLKFVALTAGSYHSCGLTAGGDAYCWGRGDFGQLGDSTNGSNTPDLVRGGQKFVAISAGAAHTCGLTSSNEAYCWGSGGSGQLGTSAALAVCQTSNAGSQPCSLVPVPVSGSLSFAALTTGFHHTCGVTTAGAGYCWGWNDHGQLGDGSGRASMVPVRVANQGAVP